MGESSSTLYVLSGLNDDGLRFSSYSASQYAWYHKAVNRFNTHKEGHFNRFFVAKLKFGILAIILLSQIVENTMLTTPQITAEKKSTLNRTQS